MSGASANLERALKLSRDLLAAAERGDVAEAVSLDAERLQLLKSARAAAIALGDEGGSLLQEINLLNDRSIGCLEHHRRIKGRQLDVAAVGRRALNAYANTSRIF
jgi:hypothetical protein